MNVCSRIVHYKQHSVYYIQAGKLAVERGWAINIGLCVYIHHTLQPLEYTYTPYTCVLLLTTDIGGGFHHCSATAGGGFCAYADITLAVKVLYMQYIHVCSTLVWI